MTVAFQSQRQFLFFFRLESEEIFVVCSCCMSLKLVMNVINNCPQATVKLEYCAGVCGLADIARIELQAEILPEKTSTYWQTLALNERLS